MSVRYPPLQHSIVPFSRDPEGSARLVLALPSGSRLNALLLLNDPLVEAHVLSRAPVPRPVLAHAGGDHLMPLLRPMAVQVQGPLYSVPQGVRGIGRETKTRRRAVRQGSVVGIDDGVGQTAGGPHHRRR